MVFHPIIALHAHVGGYVFRKTFVETSFKMNALIKLSLNFTADKIGKTFSFCFSEFGGVLRWKSYHRKSNLLNSSMINMADAVFQRRWLNFFRA